MKLTENLGGGRNSSLEVLRIVSIILVLFLHLCMYAGSSSIFTSDNTANALFANLIGSWGTAGVGCFFLISAYFSCRKSFKALHYINLLIQAELYAIGIYVMETFVLHINNFSMGGVVRVLIVPLTMQYWYLTVYLLLMLLGPFLNIMLGALDKHSVQKLLIITTVMIPVYRLFFNNAPVSYLIYGIYMYTIGYYFAFYLTQEEGKKLRDKMKPFVILLLLVVIICYFLNRGQIMNSEFILSKIRGIISPFQVFVSVFLFLSFLYWNIPQNQTVNFWARGTLAVYLVHMDTGLLQWFLNDILFMEQYYNHVLYPAILIAAAGVIFVFVTLLDTVRQVLVVPIVNERFGYVAGYIEDWMRVEENDKS